MIKKINFSQIKSHLKDNKISLLLLLAILLIGTGTTYALWQLTFSQTSTNVITTGCFKVEFADKNPITLMDAYPITDEEGKKLTPYELKITNTCDSEANYYINLETVTKAEKKLSDEYLKASLKKEDTEVFFNNLNTSIINLNKVIEESSTAYKLYEGKLTKKEEVTFYLNLWLDNNTKATNDIMDASYEGKITVATSYKKPIKNMMKEMSLDQTRSGHCDSTGCEYPISNTLYTNNGQYNNLLNKVVYQSEINPYENAEKVVDFSDSQDESVLGYYVKNEDNTYNLYIQADGKVKLNTKASYFLVTDTSIDVSVELEGYENIDISEVTDMSYMFYNFSIESLDLSNINTSKVTNMEGMFKSSYIQNLNLNGFDTSNVTNMSHMFELSSIKNVDLSSFDTSNVTNMSHMFNDTWYLTSPNLSSFDTSKVTNMDSMFAGIKGTSLDLSTFDTSKVTNMDSMFAGCYNLTSLDLSTFDTSKVTNMDSMFDGCSDLTSLNLSNFDTSKVTSMHRMFAGCGSITSLDLNHFDTSIVTNMSGMFYSVNINAFSFNEFDTSSVTNMRSMFAGIKGTSLDLTNFNTSKVVYMDYMFVNAEISELDVSSFSNENVINMSQMFYGCSKLTSINLKTFGTKNVTNMYYMFNKCSSLTTIDVSSFDTSRVIDMTCMFENCSSLTNLDLSTFDTRNVEDMRWMFSGCRNLTTIIYGKNFILRNAHNMFNNCPANTPTNS